MMFWGLDFVISIINYGVICITLKKRINFELFFEEIRGQWRHIVITPKDRENKFY